MTRTASESLSGAHFTTYRHRMYSPKKKTPTPTTNNNHKTTPAEGEKKRELLLFTTKTHRREAIGEGIVSPKLF